MPIRSPARPNSCRPRTDETDSSLRIAELDRMVVFGAEPVLENEDGDAGGVEVVRYLPAFVIRRERAISATRRDDDGGAGRLTGAEERQRRPVGIVSSERPRCPVGPEEKGFGLGVRIRLGCSLRWGGRLRVRRSIARGASYGDGHDRQSRPPTSIS